MGTGYDLLSSQSMQIITKHATQYNAYNALYYMDNIGTAECCKHASAMYGLQ